MGDVYYILLDKDRLFLSYILGDYSQRRGINILVGTAYHKTGRAKIERAHREINKFIQNVDFNVDNDNIELLLNQFLIGYNNRKGITGFSPNQLHFGYNTHLAFDMMKPLNNKIKDNDYIQEIRNLLILNNKEHNTKLIKHQKQRNIYYESKMPKKQHKFKIGELVLLNYKAIGDEYDKYEGHYSKLIYTLVYIDALLNRVVVYNGDTQHSVMTNINYIKPVYYKNEKPYIYNENIPFANYHIEYDNLMPMLHKLKHMDIPDDKGIPNFDVNIDNIDITDSKTDIDSDNVDSTEEKPLNGEEFINDIDNDYINEYLSDVSDSIPDFNDINVDKETTEYYETPDDINLKDIIPGYVDNNVGKVTKPLKTLFESEKSEDKQRKTEKRDFKLRLGFWGRKTRNLNWDSMIDRTKGRFRRILWNKK